MVNIESCIESGIFNIINRTMLLSPFVQSAWPVAFLVRRVLEEDTTYSEAVCLRPLFVCSFLWGVFHLI